MKMTINDRGLHKTRNAHPTRSSNRNRSNMPQPHEQPLVGGGTKPIEGTGGERQQGGGEGGDDESRTCSQDVNGEQKVAHNVDDGSWARGNFFSFSHFIFLLLTKDFRSTNDDDDWRP
jgi:hypothetical protein